jgi:SP family arabinose:H+ symporter-like MFS transporter
MDKQVKKISVLTITFVASLGGFLFGFDAAVVSGALPLLKDQFNFSASQEGWFVVTALIGCIVGVAISGELTDRIGRRKPLMLSAVLFLLSAIGYAVMPSLTLITLSRFIGGMGIGLASSVVPLYISELAPARSRGRLITFYQLALTIGILVAYLTNYGLVNYAHHHTGANAEGWFATATTTEVWRTMFGIGVIPSILFLVGLSFVPESPRWLFQQKRFSEGKNVMTAIGMEAEAVREAEAIANNDKEKVSYKELFSPRWRKALLLGILLPVFSQFCGINAIIYYGASILTSSGNSIDDALFSQVIFGAANMLFTLFAIWKVDSAGRRPLYLWGTAGATICLLATGISFATGNTTGTLLLICVLAFLGCFAFSIGPLKFVVAGEIFPNKIRGRAMAISIMSMWVADTIVNYLTPIMLKNIGAAGTFWTFASFCAIAFITVYKLLPETKGKSLEQIEAEWKSKENGKTTADNLPVDNIIAKTP